MRRREGCEEGRGVGRWGSWRGEKEGEVQGGTWGVMSKRGEEEEGKEKVGWKGVSKPGARGKRRG